MSEEKNTLKDHYNYLQKCLIKLEADNRHFNSLDALYKKAKLNVELGEVSITESQTEEYTIDDLKCCGNCGYYDAWIDDGNICCIIDQIPKVSAEFTAICKHWKYNYNKKR